MNDSEDMHDDGRAAPALTPWMVCVAILAAPAALVWFVRIAALAGGCAPGPGLCHGLALGAGLRDALALCWTLTGNATLLIGFGMLTAILAFRARRPMLGTLTILILPAGALLLPLLAVYSASYGPCTVSTEGAGACQLWGTAMGMSFHNAAAARDGIYGIVPTTFALTVMMGVAGFFYVRQCLASKPRRIEHTGQSPRYDDDGDGDTGQRWGER